MMPSNCGDCPLRSDVSIQHDKYCSLHWYDKEHTSKIVDVVERWSKENPEKTILQDFLEKYPNAPISELGIPENVCPHMLGYKKSESKCIPDEYFCKKCWNKPLEE